MINLNGFARFLSLFTGRSKMYVRVTLSAQGGKVSDVMFGPFFSKEKRNEFKEKCKKVLGVGVIITDRDKPLKRIRLASPEEGLRVLEALEKLRNTFLGD